MIRIRMSYRPSQSRILEEGEARLDTYLAPNYLKTTSKRTGHKSSISETLVAAQSIIDLEDRGDEARPRASSTSNIVQTQLALEADIQSFNARVDATQCQSDTTEQADPQQHPQHPSTIRADSKEAPRVIVPVEASAAERASLTSTPPESTLPSLLPMGTAIKMISLLQATNTPSPVTPAKPPRPPSHFEMGLLESQENQAETGSNAEWEEIQKLRIQVWSLRSQIHEMRNTLREKQDTKSTADDILFRRMTVHSLIQSDQSVFIGRGQKTLAELMQDCQVARDEYGPLEDDCNQLEDQLSAQEFKLARLENHYYMRPNTPNNPKPDMSNLSAFQRAGPPSLILNEDEDLAHEIGDTQYHPLVTEYLSKLGDLDLLQERLYELMDEKESLEVERDSRLRYGLALDPEDQVWLENSQNAEDELAEKIRLLEQDLESKKQECMSRGLVDEEGEPTSFQRQEQVSFDGEEDVDPKNQKSEYVKYPLLLPRPGMKHEELVDYEPKPDEASDTTASRINEWMLDKLRMSALDVSLLARTFEGWFGQINDSWQIAVLQLWYRDGTIETTGRYRVYTSSMTTQAPPISHPSDPAPKHIEDDRSFGLFLASSIRFPSDPSDTKQIAFILRNSPAPPRGKFNRSIE
jgi:hypothetical protein